MILQRYDNLRELVARNFSKLSQDLVDKALDFASERLSGLSRYDGNPMLLHGVGVAQIVIEEVGLGRNSTLASILHDVVRLSHKEQSEEEFFSLSNQIKELFGAEVLGIAIGLCNISEIKLKAESEQAENFRELIISYSTDPRVILIKLADRLEVMRSLEIFPADKWRKKSWETLNLYAQIAHKLGLYGIKSELEDISLRYLEPSAYKEISTKLAEGERERQEFVERFVQPIESKLKAAGLEFHIKSRAKSIYSIWNKMHKQKIRFEDIFDIFAIRIIIECEKQLEKQQCWLAYSVVSDCYTPNIDRLKDWISIPKSNGYESLHTTVMGGNGRWVEIQIRSDRMDRIAERGIAAHWRYKGVNQGAASSEEWLGRLRELMESNTDSIADRFDATPTSSEIFVFTPNGDIRKLPKGATILDFAFEIHTNLGTKCSGGKINGRAVSIRERLKSGDVVEILSQKNQTPRADWLSSVVTSKARGKIKAYLTEQTMQSSKLGREELERKIKNWKISISIDEAVAHLCRHFKVKRGVELYDMIANEKIDISSVKELLLRHLSGQAEEERRAAAAELERSKREMHAQRAEPKQEDALVIEDGLGGLEYKLGKCCNPIKGDNIFGFITVSAGVTIHRSDCPNANRLREQYPYRVIEASWRSSASGAFRVTLAIVTKDQPGITAQISEVISRDLKLSLRAISLVSREDGTVAGSVSVEVPSVGTVDTLIHSLLRIKGVMKAYRSNN